jgi:hypothetical protein
MSSSRSNLETILKLNYQGEQSQDEKYAAYFKRRRDVIYLNKDRNADIYIDKVNYYVRDLKYEKEKRMLKNN